MSDPVEVRSSSASAGPADEANGDSEESLPFVDEHRQRVDADEGAVWAATLDGVRRMGGGGRFGRWLGCDPARATAEFEGRSGDAVPGFRVENAEPGRRLVLGGRHRFAVYRLTFVIERGLLRARTHAAFPGLRGRLYRAMVIGSGAHRRIVRRLLGRIARRAGASASPVDRDRDVRTTTTTPSAP